MTPSEPHNKLKRLLDTHEIEVCVRNGEKKKEWYPVTEIDTSKDIEDYRVGKRIYDNQTAEQ